MAIKVATWLKALRSGEYKQGKNFLKDSYGGYCCLGVGCKVARVKFQASTNDYDGEQFPPRPFLSDLPVEMSDRDNNVHVRGRFNNLISVSDLNDGINGKHYSFKKIADRVEKTVEYYRKKKTK